MEVQTLARPKTFSDSNVNSLLRGKCLGFEATEASYQCHWRSARLSNESGERECPLQVDGGCTSYFCMDYHGRYRGWHHEICRCVPDVKIQRLLVCRRKQIFPEFCAPPSFFSVIPTPRTRCRTSAQTLRRQHPAHRHLYLGHPAAARGPRG